MPTSFFRGATGIFVALMVFGQAAIVAAQTPEEVAPPGEGSESQVAIRPVISGPDDIAVGRTIILDGSESDVLGENVQYLWYVEGQQAPISRSVDALYTPEERGSLLFRLVIRSTIGREVREAEATHMVIVYDRKMLLLADSTVPPETLAFHRQTAQSNGLYLQVLQPAEERLLPGAIAQLLRDHIAALDGAEAVIVWTDGIEGLQALMHALQQRDDPSAVADQSIVLITRGSLGTLGRIARGPFSVLHPKRILVTRPEALSPLLSLPSLDAFLEEARVRSLEHLVLDPTTVSVRPWNALSMLVNYMVASGVSSQTVILLLMLPVIATILSFLKQVIGITTFGLFTPSIVALSFLALRWQIGVLFLLFIITTGYATRALMQRWHLLPVPKVAIILTVVSITLLALLGIGATFGIVLAPDTIFILLIMSTLAESFLNVKTEQGWSSAVAGIGQTIGAALLCVLIVQIASFQSLVLAYPEVILLTILANIILGRWTGLRIVEFFRFRELFRHMQEE